MESYEIIFKDVSSTTAVTILHARDLKSAERGHRPLHQYCTKHARGSNDAKAGGVVPLQRQRRLDDTRARKAGYNISSL